MNMLASNWKAAIVSAAYALLLFAALLNGCGYDANFVQINDGVTATSDPLLSLAIHGEDPDQVRAYYILEVGSTETPTAPAASDGGWNAIPVAQQATVYDTVVTQSLRVVSPATQPASGKKTIYVWFKDGYGNVSDAVSDTITYGSTSGGGVCTTPGYCN